MPQPVRSFHIVGDQFTELEALPEALPPTATCGSRRRARRSRRHRPTCRPGCRRWTGAQLFELHILDLLNSQLPSHYDYTSAYDLLVFRRLAAGAHRGRSTSDGPPSQAAARARSA